MPEPVSKYDQGLTDSPRRKRGLRSLGGRSIPLVRGVDKRIPGNNAVLKIMRNGVCVLVKLKKDTKDFHKRNFDLARTQVAKQDWDDNAIPTLKQAAKIMAFFRELEQKTRPLDI